MTTFGSPFKQGTLSSLLLGIALTVVMIYFYLSSPVRNPIFLILIALATLSTIGSYFRYKTMSRQQGNDATGGSD